MFKRTIAATIIATTTLTSLVHAESGVEIRQPSTDSKAVEVGIGAGVGVGISVGAAAAALSAAGIAAVPHVGGGMILISTATGASYIAGTLGLIGGAVACVGSFVCAAAVVGGAAIAIGGGYYAYEALSAKEIEYDDVIIEKRHIAYLGVHYVQIKDKFVTPEKRKKLNRIAKIAKNTNKKAPYYVDDGVLLDNGLLNDRYYVQEDIAENLRSQFNSGGLYEVDAKDSEN